MAEKFLQIPVLALNAHGGTRVLADLANTAAAQGYGVRFLIPPNGISKNYDLHPNVEIKPIGFSKFGKYAGQLLFLIIAPFYMRRGTLVANFFPTVFSIWLASFLFQRPSIYIVQGIETWFKGRMGSILNAMCRLTWHSRRMVTISPFIADTLKSFGFTPWQQIKIGISPPFFDTPAVTALKKFDVICFPRPESFKRLDRILKITADYRQRYGDLRVLCVGQDETVLATCRTADMETLRPENDVALISAIDSARVLLFTSEMEGLGLPPLEAMARGLPCIVFENSGVKAYLKHEQNGFMATSEEAAVNYLHGLLHNPEQYDRMSLAARQTADQFSTRKAFETLLRAL